MRIDLHTHSTCSDGTDTPAELVAKAARSLDVVALTDHDTTHGWAEALAAAEHHSIRLVRGIELSTRHGSTGQHLLGYGFDPNHPELVALLGKGVEARDGRIPAILARLATLGLELDEHAVLEQSRASGGTVGRPHVASALVAAGYVRDVETAFDHYLKPGRPGYVERYAPSTVEAIRAISAAGGVTVIAHPRGARGALGDRALEELVAAGLAGVEVDHQEHDPTTREELRGLAADLGVVATGSSDYHGTRKTDHDLGCNTTSPEALEELLDAAAHGG